MPRLSVALLCLVLGVSMSLPAAAQWKWRAKDGKVQYSDLPPPTDIADRDILQRPASSVRRDPNAAAVAAPSASVAASATALAPSGIDPKLEAERKKIEQQEAARKKAEEDKQAASRADNCARARTYMRSLDDGMRIARTNAKGEREILDDKARADETQRTRSIIAADCK